MVEVIAVRQLASQEIAAMAESVVTSFASLPEAPVALDRGGEVTAAVRDEIVQRHARHGFAIAQFPSRSADPVLLLTVSQGLGLGPPFVPPLYSNGTYAGGPINTIAAPSGRDSSHPSFERSVGLDLHCDGTLQPIGYVATSLLLCHTRATEGGETVLFNAPAAFAELAADDQLAAVALATPGVLVRQANLNGSVEAAVGPVVAARDGRLVFCYSVSLTDRWEEPEGIDPEALARGLAHMQRAATEPSPFLIEFALGDDQLLVLDNSSLSHGRRPYRDSGGRRRCVYRSLHLKRPGSLT